MPIVLPMLLAMAAPSPVPGILRRAGDCAWLRGRFTVANGSSINRIWMVGTGHMLALYDDDTDVPPAVRRFWDQPRPFDHALWGDFYVCARERRIAGHMQHVRIRATRRTIMVLR